MAAKNIKGRPLCPKCKQRRMVRGPKSPGGKMRWRCVQYDGHAGHRTICYTTTDPTAPVRSSAPAKAPVLRQEVRKTTLVVTWAQNATPVHKPFLAALKTYCKANDAQLIVIPGRYKNPTSVWSASQADEQWWDAALVPFLLNHRIEVNSNLTLLADIRVQPTAVRPLQGFEGLTHGESAIVGHPKLQMNVIPTPHQKLPKILTTTGAVTVENYTDSKAGKKGEFHHVLGAVVLELEGNYFHLRHINARKNGSFCDLNQAYFADGRVEPAGPYEALVLGDTHVRFTDAAVDAATFEKNGLVESLNPKALVFHDLLDNYAVNPHHFGNPYIGVAKYRNGLNSVEAEIQQACLWVQKRVTSRKAFIVASNHNDFLNRWMKSQDWRMDPANAELYLETALKMVRQAAVYNSGAVIPDPFIMWAEKLLKGSKNIKCVPRNESLMLAGIECSLHGDEGPSGSRGSRANLSQIGAKTIIGHSHTPGILDGCYQTGTSTALSLEYTGPVSNWLQAHVSIDPMGKRHVHVLVNGKFWR